MPNNPVQVVLNSSSYLVVPEPGGGGNDKDFFAGRDREFALHRQAIGVQIAEARRAIEASGQPYAVAHVATRSDGWAKSHRPTRKLFRPNQSPSVGTDDLGELLVEVSAASLEATLSQMAKAEAETRYVTDDSGKTSARPSRTRSELGALSSIRLHDRPDRRKFSLDAAIEWFQTKSVSQGYLVQLFELPSTESDGSRAQIKRQQYSDLEQALTRSGASIEGLEGWWAGAGFVWVAIRSNGDDVLRPLHNQCLSILETSPLVRRIWLPAEVKASAQPSLFPDVAGFGESSLPSPADGQTYATLCVVDTGVKAGVLDDWLSGGSEMVEPDQQNQFHGTFIGGLIVAGSHLNPVPDCDEQPCKIFDLALQVTDPQLASQTYPRGFVSLLEQLDFELPAAKAAGARIVSMSLAVEELVEDDSYSPYAAFIDALSDKHDVVFVLPAGNLPESHYRSAWPNRPTAVLEAIARYRYLGQDRLLRPAESLRSVTVGALDPARGQVTPRPAAYSRRGPGTGLSAKPDFAHIGGSADFGGLVSVSTDGTLVESEGTSFATPLVAKTLANIEASVEGSPTRELITAIATHSATVPVCLATKTLHGVARDFVGVGVPRSARDSLVTADDAITLVFQGTMLQQRALVFDFPWPASLTAASGACRGEVTMTLAYSPPVDIRAGAEAVRVNLEAYLRQEYVHPRTGEVSYKGFFKNESGSSYERERIREGHKWGPIKKRYRKTLPAGVGNSSQWRLVVEPLARAGEVLPEDGIPFSLLLTIRDSTGQANIFDEMRRSLRSIDVDLADIRVAQRARLLGAP